MADSINMIKSNWWRPKKDLKNITGKAFISLRWNQFLQVGKGKINPVKKDIGNEANRVSETYIKCVCLLWKNVFLGFSNILLQEVYVAYSI